MSHVVLQVLLSCCGGVAVTVAVLCHVWYCSHGHCAAWVLQLQSLLCGCYSHHLCMAYGVGVRVIMWHVVSQLLSPALYSDSAISVYEVA